MEANDVNGISVEELQLAARNHGMPLEALRYPITPVGLHYLLIHYDIPLVDPSVWRLAITGLVRSNLSLCLDELRARRGDAADRPYARTRSAVSCRAFRR